MRLGAIVAIAHPDTRYADQEAEIHLLKTHFFKTTT
jgi:hypothetical protein